MKKNFYLNMHEKFTDVSNATIKLEELLEYMKKMPIKDQVEWLIEFLKLSEINSKEHLKEIMDYADYLEKRNFSAEEKRKVIDVKKVISTQKKYFNDKIKEYDREIKEIIALNYDEFVKYIEDKGIDYNYLMLGIIKEINLYRILADEAYVNKEVEMVLEAKNLILDLENKLNYLKNKNDSKQVIVNEEKNCRIIFLDTSSLRTYFLEDIKGLDEYYDSFNKIFSSLESGNPYDVRYFGSVDKNLEGLAETRDLSGKTRIFFKKLTEDTYIVIGAIVKKVDRTYGYKNQIENRYKYYLQQESYILEHLNDEDFIRLQEGHLDEVKRKIKGGGNING